MLGRKLKPHVDARTSSMILISTMIICNKHGKYLSCVRSTGTWRERTSPDHFCSLSWKLRKVAVFCGDLFCRGNRELQKRSNKHFSVSDRFIGIHEITISRLRYDFRQNGGATGSSFKMWNKQHLRVLKLFPGLKIAFKIFFYYTCSKTQIKTWIILSVPKCFNVWKMYFMTLFKIFKDTTFEKTPLNRVFFGKLRQCFKLASDFLPWRS